MFIDWSVTTTNVVLPPSVSPSLPPLITHTSPSLSIPRPWGIFPSSVSNAIAEGFSVASAYPAKATLDSPDSCWRSH